jgi:uncharacterized membrane protein YphA (DoxX/SURF4 family)
MKGIVKVCKYLVGLLFIFSGFVKADDPLGFAYKLQEYFAKDALNLPWLDGFALTFSIVIPIVEMVLGFMIIIGAYRKFTLWMLLLTILFFLFLTFYTAYYNKVLECGCFGDAIPMTPWQSFGKNVVLFVLIIILFIGSWHISPSFARGIQNTLITLFTLASIGFSLYCYNYLPVIDFRPYKPGTDIKKAMQGVPDVLKYYYTLKNKKSGTTQEFTEFPPNYQNDWDYVSNRTELIKKGKEPKIKDFAISSLTGNDLTDSILSAPGYTFLLVSSSLDKANKGPDVIKAINEFATNCMKNHIGFICLTASADDDIQKYTSLYKTAYPFYTTDDTQLRTMIRSNPGLVLIKGGVVVADWHYHSIPDYTSVNQKYLNKQ